MFDKTLISIITPCLNRMEYITEAIESVLNQNYPFVEHLIMDGGSTDGTFEVLNQYPHLKVFSEPDDNLYEALNKGLELASGDVIGFLNTDDYYEQNIFNDIASRLSSNPHAQAIVGKATIFFEDNSKGINKRKVFPEIPPDQLLIRSTRGTPIFNAWFFRKSLFNSIGVFNSEYHYAADREFLIRMALNPIEYTYTDKILYHYRQHAESLTIGTKTNPESDPVYENIRIAESYIANPDISSFARKCFINWYCQLMNELVLYSIRKLLPDKALTYALQGWRRNPIWPISFTIFTTSTAIRWTSKRLLGH